jgi:hypothetical protein
LAVAVIEADAELLIPLFVVAKIFKGEYNFLSKK